MLSFVQALPGMYYLLLSLCNVRTSTPSATKSLQGIVYVILVLRIVLGLHLYEVSEIAKRTLTITEIISTTQSC
jgi:hypothetical protein